VHQGGGLKRLPGLPPAHVGGGEAAQLVVDVRQQLGRRGAVAAPYLHQQALGLFLEGSSHAGSF